MELILKDGKKISIENGKNGHDVALSIAESLAKNSIAYKLNDKLFDLYRPINEDGKFELITKESPEAFHILNHSAAHLMAEAISLLFKGAKFGVGPAIEDGFYYDVDLNGYVLKEDDLRKIESKMKELSKKNEYIIREDVSKEKALEIFKDDEYKEELISELSENDEISVYKQGSYVDLCLGPHVPSTGFVKYFKLDTIAGAYWRGNSENKQLTRIYGLACFTKEELEEKERLKEEAKKRDHRKIGKELGLFMISEFGPGFPFFLPNGLMLRRQIENWWYKIHDQYGYKLIKTPIILSKELWLTSGHWDHYKENMYTTKIDERDFAIKPMNCPGAILVYNSELHSYKDLPLRLGELGLVHRHEASGALNGLFRVRCFTQDDAHIFCTREQLKSEIETLLGLYDKIYSVFGLDYAIVLSTKPEKDYIGDDAIWAESEAILADACKASGHEFKINPGDGAFYGPKLDFKLKDCMGRIWQCGTIQLDMNLPERFDCTYINSKGEKERPIMLHRAILGSFERFIGIITEHFAGAFPIWCAPLQIKVLPVNSKVQGDYAKNLVDKLREEDFRVELDDSDEKLGYRLRNSVIKKVPYALVIGDKEMENGTVTYRKYGSEKQITVSLEEFIKMVKEEIKTKALLVDPKNLKLS